ncbi:CHAT domain-containing protein [Lusitaniella coriacea]|uniref:FHA domain-containing protein n=1 Tax=Lusitaniella coriacea TaxID=1983105 RepID=UPI003CEA76EE
MPVGVNPCLSLAIARLSTASPEHFAIWVLQAPLPGAYVHHDCIWLEELTQQWLAWQQMFSVQNQPHLPVVHPLLPTFPPLNPETSARGYSGRLMQEFGMSLWRWLFSGSIRNSLAQSRGMAIGQSKPLRLRLDIRDPNLIPLPWEIMQPEAGKQSIALNQQLLFSRTTNDVDPLSSVRAREELNILLVLGQNSERASQSDDLLQLQQEADILIQAIKQHPIPGTPVEHFSAPVPARVQPLIQPTTAALIDALEQGNYNVFFYAGHGIPAPDGGSLLLSKDATINGTELAQVLARTKIVLAVFNACWGAQPDRIEQRTIPRSSLAEVLIHHGVPAVLAMRDLIADREALSFIETFTEALAQRMPIDLAVAMARQQLLTLYKFNQPAWTLPILYMHPEFEGELIQSIDRGITELPTILPSHFDAPHPVALLRSLEDDDRVWQIRGGLMRVGRRPENDLVISEQWVSQKHAKIFCRETGREPGASTPSYFLEDDSRYGTFISSAEGWQKIHHQEVVLQSGVQIKFGSLQGQGLEFAIEVE